MKTLAFCAGVALVSANNQRSNWDNKNWEWRYPDHPVRKEKNNVIAAFFKQDSCSGPVSVVNTKEHACQPLPVTYHKWWDSNERYKNAYDDDSYSGDGSWSSSSSSSSSSSEDGKGVKHYNDLAFSEIHPKKDYGFFTVKCNRRNEHDYDWHEHYDDWTGTTDSSSSSSSSSSSDTGKHYRTKQGYWNPRPVGGKLFFCKDSLCSKCREVIWFQPLKCLAQKHYGWDYLCTGNKRHRSCGFDAVQAVCVAAPHRHKKVKKVTEVDSSSSSAA